MHSVGCFPESWDHPGPSAATKSRFFLYEDFGVQFSVRRTRSNCFREGHDFVCQIFSDPVNVGLTTEAPATLTCILRDHQAFSKCFVDVTKHILLSYRLHRYRLRGHLLRKYFFDRETVVFV
eukprot:Lithocolla_globosa_v1_NODE_6226_length_1120_cov_4.907042.p2 type:complete len:122 gc:universal NODE_6226_length_1120_cov_4.907042:592-957(+)